MAKFRSGFVSNSSSSSFIIGIGIIKDVVKFDKALEIALESKQNYKDDLEVKTLGEWRETSGGWCGPKFQNGYMVIDSFDYSEVSVKVEGLANGTLIAVMDTCGELTEDFEFQEDEDDYELDYSLSPTEEDETRMNIFYADGIDHAETCGGAGRNG